jgi:hypothetical protein
LFGKIRPPPNTRRFRKIFTRLAAKSFWLDQSYTKSRPSCLVSAPGGQAVWKRIPRVKRGNSSTKTKHKINRFGITTENGPPVFSIQERRKWPDSTLMCLSEQRISFTSLSSPSIVNATLGRRVIPLIPYTGCDFYRSVADDKWQWQIMDGITNG